MSVKRQQIIDIYAEGPKVSTHTLGLIPPPCFIFETCNFADGILSLLIRGHAQ